MPQSIIRKLRQFETLDSVDAHALDQALLDTHDHASRAELVKSGVKPQFSVVMLSGWAINYTVMRNGSRQITDVLLPGDFCHLNAASKAPLDYTTSALSPACVARVYRTDLERLFAKHPNIATAFRESEVADEVRKRALLTIVARGTAGQRLGHMLCDIWTRADTAGLIENGKLDFPATQSDMADYIGLTAVHLNRMLQRLRADGLIEFQGRSLILPDFRSLARMSEYAVRDTGNRNKVPTIDLRPTILPEIASFLKQEYMPSA